MKWIEILSQDDSHSWLRGIPPRTVIELFDCPHPIRPLGSGIDLVCVKRWLQCSAGGFQLFDWKKGPTWQPIRLHNYTVVKLKPEERIVTVHNISYDHNFILTIITHSLPIRIWTVPNSLPDKFHWNFHDHYGEQHQLSIRSDQIKTVVDSLDMRRPPKIHYISQG